MRKTKIIRPFLALVLLLLFVIGNSPVQLLHNVFANHTDVKKGALSNTTTDSLHPQSFHCQCDHLVVESPFIAIVYISSPSCFFSYPQFTHSLYAFTIKGWLGNPLLRGPPVA